MMETEVFVNKTYTGTYHWFVIGDFNDHVLAQGVAKTIKTARRQANEAELLIKADLWQNGVSPL